MNTVIIAIVMGIMYWWCRGMILSYFGFLFISSPVTVGLVAGLLMGQPMQGLIIGGGIALVFAGIFAPGANLPTDECLAATCVIPIAIGSGMNATTAIALAVPVGLLGSFVTNLRKVINTYFVAKANKYAEEGNADAIWRCATIYPALLAIPLLFLPVFIINMVGQDVVINIMKALPTFVTHGLEVAGGVLPALGFALIMNMIGKNKLIPFVFLGYIVVSVGGVNSLTAGIIAICIAFITVFPETGNCRGGKNMNNEMNTQEENKVLTQKDLNKAMFRWYMSAEMPLNFENMQGIAFCGSISHILKKLYTKKEDLSEALKRHLLLYNCNVTAGGLILGTTIAMEEQRAKDPSKMPDMAITGLKTGLMGPVAALGDSFDWGIIGTLMKIAAATLAAAGNPLALVVLLLFVGYCIGELILTTNMTYKKGRESIKTIMGSGLMQDVISGANVLAMFMMVCYDRFHGNIKNCVKDQYSRSTG